MVSEALFCRSLEITIYKEFASNALAGIRTNDCLQLLGTVQQMTSQNAICLPSSADIVAS